MSYLKIITKAKTVSSYRTYDKHTKSINKKFNRYFFNFNKSLKTELFYNKHKIQSFDYLYNNNNPYELECHIDVKINKDESNIVDNVIIKDLVQQLVGYNVFIEINYLKYYKVNKNNIFLL